MAEDNASITFRCPVELRSIFLVKCNSNYSKMSIELRKLMKKYADGEIE